MDMAVWQYQLVTGDDLSTIVGEGTVEIPKGMPLEGLNNYWSDVLADLSKQSGQGIQWEGKWRHWADDNLDPLEGDGVVTKGQVRYGLGPHMGNRVNVTLIAV